VSYDASIRVSTIIDIKDVERAEKEVDRLVKKLDSVRARSAKLETLGGTEKQFESLGYDAELLEKQLEKATLKAEELRSVFNQQNSENAFSRATKSAKTLFTSIRNGSEKANKGLVAMYSMFRRIMMRMILMKAIVAVINSIKTGIDNLVHYSSDLNGAFSDLKSSSVQLKNSLATAFSPILTMIIPYITQLISWLNTAMNYISQFWAVLGGKNTYTRAKKQVVDYAKSLKGASKEAKGALAAFDEINVLNKDEGAGGGGEATGAGAFEEAPVDSAFAEMVEKVKAALEAILPLVILIGAALLAWNIYDFLAKLMLANPLLGTIVAAVMAVAGAALAVYSYIQMWKDGVDWKGIIGFVAGVTMAVTALYMLFGPLVAGIALIIAGIAGVVLALHDIIENGVTAENIGLLLISVVGLLTGVFFAFGGTATLIVGIITAVLGVLALLVAYGGNGTEALKHLQAAFKSLGEFIKKVFAGDFKGALEDLKKAGRSFGNFFISVAEGIANGFIKMVNAVIDAINSIKIDVPGWLQKITGMQTFGFNLPHWNKTVSLPRLATGGIVTSSTIANIGESGREAVLPLENNTEWMDQLSEKINSRPTKIVFTGDLAELGRILKPVIENEDGRIGPSFEYA
jgi:hypothetical protein